MNEGGRAETEAPTGRARESGGSRAPATEGGAGGRTDDAHAVVQAAGPQAALRNLEAAAAPQQKVALRHHHVLEVHLPAAASATPVIVFGNRLPSYFNLYMWPHPSFKVQLPQMLARQHVVKIYVAVCFSKIIYRL